MSETKFVIDGYYDFGIFADGPRPSSCGESGIHLQFDHEDVMELGEYFIEEDPCEMDVDYNYGIKDELDDILVERIAAEVKEEWKAENDDDEDADIEEPDFYDLAYERMGEMYYCWDEQFKEDCINYYLAHKDD